MTLRYGTCVLLGPLGVHGVALPGGGATGGGVVAWPEVAAAAAAWRALGLSASRLRSSRAMAGGGEVKAELCCWEP